MFAAVRSELTRLRQPRLLLTWLGLMTLFALMINTIMVTFVSGGGSLPPGAPGVAFPTLAEMESPTGLMAGREARGLLHRRLPHATARPESPAYLGRDRGLCHGRTGCSRGNLHDKRELNGESVS